MGVGLFPVCAIGGGALLRGSSSQFRNDSSWHGHAISNSTALLTSLQSCSGDAARGCETCDSAGACVCPTACKKFCTDSATRCGGGKLGDDESGSCSPWYFKPMSLGSDCWIDDWEAMKAILPSDARSYQVWQDYSAEDRWVMHGCDGAGAQMMDCLGD